MNLLEVKDALYDITEMFFKGATIIWSEQITTRPTAPYITLKFGGIQRSSFPIIDDEGRRVYSCKTIFTVNLYTKGKPIKSQGKQTTNYINTATSDMMDFANFVESIFVTDKLADLGMDVSLVPPVKDLSELQNDSQYRYRSMAEFQVSYAEAADGAYGMASMPMLPNASGGGNAELLSVEVGEITEVEITENTEGGNSDEEQ